jgi:hypothetical protein
MIDKAYIIVLDRAPADKLNATHELIKQKADKWWHRYDSVWIVEGGTAGEWRNLIRPLFEGTTTSILVFELPRADASRNWSSFGVGAKEKFEWLKDEYKK